MFRGKTRDRRVRHLRPVVERVPDRQCLGVDQRDHVTGVGRVDRGALRTEHRLGVLGGERPPRGGVGEDHPSFEPARADPDEGHPVPVVLVHVGLHLEDLAGEGTIHRTRPLVIVDLGRRRGGQVHHCVQQLPHTEVGQRGTEQHRGGFPRQEGFGVVVRTERLQEFDLLLGLGPGVLFDLGRLVRVENPFHRPLGTTGGPRHLRVTALTAAVDQTTKVTRDTDRPVQRGGTQTDALLDLVQELQRFTAGPIPLVDERDHGHLAGPTHVEELQGLDLQPLGRVQEHDRAVHGGQHTIGVLREVGVARGVQQVEDVVVVGDTQRGRRDGDTAVLLHLHPVGGHSLAVTLAVHGPRRGDRRGVQRQRLGQRGLTGVRVGDDGEGPTTSGLLRDLRSRPARGTDHTVRRIRTHSRCPSCHIRLLDLSRLCAHRVCAGRLRDGPPR